MTVRACHTEREEVIATADTWTNLEIKLGDIDYDPQNVVITERDPPWERTDDQDDADSIPDFGSRL